MAMGLSNNRNGRVADEGASSSESSLLLGDKGGSSSRSGSAHAAASTQKSWQRILGNLAACAAWIFASTSIIVANRIILVEKKFPYPMAVTSMGMAVSGIAGFIACDVLRLGIPKAELSRRDYLVGVLPVGVAQGLAGWLSNGLYMYLTVAFIEMARATLPLFIMLALHISGLESPTMDVVKAVTLTALGCGVAAYGEVALSVLGITFLLGNFSLEAGRLVMMQFLLVGCNYHPMQGLKLIAPGAVGALMVLIAFHELPKMIEANAFQIVFDNIFLFLFAASLGLIVNLLSMVIIKLSSATTLKVLAAARGPIVVMSGVILFSETVTQIQAVGYCVALVGFVWYQYAKAQQDLAKAAKMDATPSSQPNKDTN